MTCAALEQLELCARGQLSAAERDAIVDHLATCAACRQRLAEVRDNLQVAGRVAQHANARPLDSPGDVSVALPNELTISNVDRSAARSAEDAPVAPTIPGYRVLRVISHGGQGVVYQALQEETKRKVAIKVLLEGPLASVALRRRFEREIELAAQLRHPNIVSVFHSGTTADGRQYLVMDYIRGAPLTVHVREQRLPLEAALVSFAAVCEAVQHAHQRGVIHRDLKPSNILVDAEGQPRVLDFGLAKRMGGTDDTLATMSQQLLGTVPYMSPEQTRGNPDEMDTRSDVYSLGVVLYETLTGEFPYPVTGPMADVLRHIAETAPTPPSRRWRSESGISGRVSGRGRSVQCPIDGELETIVLKALAKERERRYQSAGELARDLRHYLTGEPIEARRDSGLYMLRKALRRYRAAVVVAGAFAALIAIFAAAMTVQSLRVRDQRDRARGAEQLAEKRLATATAAREDAERARRQAETVVAFLRTALSGANPLAGDPEMTVAEMLDWAAEALESGPRHDPLVEAAVRDMLGLSYLGLGRHADAERQLSVALELRRREMGDEHRDTLNTQHNLATVLRAAGRAGRAAQLWREVLDHGAPLTAADPALAFCAAAGLAEALHDEGKFDDADALYQRTLAARDAVLDDHPDSVVGALNGYARLLVNRKQTDAAQAILDESLDLQTRFLPVGHIYRIETLRYLGMIAGTRGRLDQSQARFNEARELCRARLPADHPRTLEVEHQLGRVLGERGQSTAAATLLRSTLTALEQRAGRSHLETLATAGDLANVLIEAGDLDAADAVIRNATAGVAGEPSDMAVALWNSMALLPLARGQWQAADEIASRTLERRSRLFGPRHSQTARSAHLLGCILMARERPQDAEPRFRDAVAATEGTLGPQHWLLARFRSDLGDCLAKQERWDDAARELRAALAALESTLGPEHPLAREARARLTRVLDVSPSAADAAATRPAEPGHPPVSPLTRP
ncbi:MAG: tetratricopeptide repeat protein [Phycisphaerae bacterium]